MLDLQYCRKEEAAEQALAALLHSAAGAIGLRIDRAEALSPSLLALVGERPYWLILAEPEVARHFLSRRSQFARARLLVEIRDVADLAAFSAEEDLSFIARGHESGGWVGEDSTFILLQKLLRCERRPVFVQGGLGENTAAACRAVGAAGVVLDDQLLLMPESDLPPQLQRQLNVCKGQDARVFGERLDGPVRVISRPGLSAAARLASLSTAAEAGDWSKEKWRAEAAQIIGWGSPDETAWPVGQGIEAALPLRDQFKTTGRLIRAFLDRGSSNLNTAIQTRPLAEGSSLAQSHGLRYPIFQGPMTRVSDTARFADDVSRAGGMPFLALALMSGEQCSALFKETQALAGSLPWGVGLLGFIPKELRDQQIEAVLSVKPPCALIAGGRPDQAAVFEENGIAAYIHVPSADLLRMFVDQGARRFVFEGRECGGHIGPLTSFVLWEAQIRVLLEKATSKNAGGFHVLFAGGINDAKSAAMVAVLAAPLVERGVRIGVLMGSAYLMTREIVQSGAIVPEFQAQALSCKRTISLESGPGHASRCAVTPFAHEFYRMRRSLLNSGASGDEIREKLEDLNLGRLRIASKGKNRKDSEIVDVDPATQVQEGMYMIGQCATLCDDIVTVSELHEIVSAGATRLLAAAADTDRAEEVQAKPADIAIIGIGALLPKATTPQEYWRNILTKRNAIGEIPKDRFDWRLYFDEDRKAKDKIYSRWGGFLDEIPFDPMRYGIPPNSLKSIDPLQLLTLEVVRRGIEDAGYAEGKFNREKTSIVLGASGGLGDVGLQYGVRAEMARIVDQIHDDDYDRLPEWTEESFAGCLPNVAAGRVANRFDFGGLNFTVDAACASSLAAVNIAVDELVSGRSDMAIAGGIDTVQSPFAYMCFAKTSALSPTGQPRTFDTSSDGIVISEGLAVVVMKRLADAQRDGDRIYAVIKAVAGSSDGKALGLTAPLPAGQKRALNRAYAKAGFSPSTLDFVEAHGTGTSVGDRAEAETIIDSLKSSNTAPKNCAVGSVKTILGHTKGTAGIAGLIKVALALHHKVLPPHFGVTDPIGPIAADDSPVYLLNEPRPFHRHPDHPRRGASSAFGFGGTNFHAVLEEYADEYRSAAQPAGSDEWPCELFVFRAPDKAELERQIAAIHSALEVGATFRLSDLAYTLALKADQTGPTPFAASIATGDLAGLARDLGLLLKDLRGEPRQATPPYVSLALGDLQPAGEIAFLFPGQGAQYPDMAREAALYLPAIREAVESADRVLGKKLPKLLSRYINPPTAFSGAAAERQKAELTDTRVAQPAIGAVSLGFLDLARQLGLKPAMTAGHSYGELTALHAAGCLSRDDFFTLSGLRGEVMASACNAEVKGGMAAIRAAREDVETALRDHPGIVIANHNGPRQTVVSGPLETIKSFAAALKNKGVDALLLPVAGAFHSALMAPIKADLDAGIEAVVLGPETSKVFSNSTGGRYPECGEEKRRILTDHLLNSVEFVAEVENMYAAGARVFVELGPKSILTGMTDSILADRPHIAVSFDGGGLRGVLSALGALAAKGAVPFNIVNLFSGRIVSELNLGRLASLRLEEPLSPTSWLLSGGCIRPQSVSVLQTGRLPMLALEDRQAASAARQREVSAGDEKKAPAGERSKSQGVDRLGAAQPVNGGVSRGDGGGDSPLAAIASSNGQAVANGGHRNSRGDMADVLVAYQNTMRQFISVQEQVMTAYLSGSSFTAAQPSTSRSIAPPIQSHRAPDHAPEPRLVEPAPAPARAPAPAASAEPALDRAALTALLLEQVSERTGYPTEMLGLDQDIEAELGIDSIKRVEILGALQGHLPEGLTATLKADMETLTRVKTLDGLIAHLIAGQPAAGSDGVAPTPAHAPAPAASAEPALDRAALTALLLEQVSERTGYPTEMLGLDQDIEAELGIDSIKRVEILGALQGHLPEGLTATLKADMETLTRVKTLDGLITHLIASQPATGAVGAANSQKSAAVEPPQPAAPTDADERNSIPRFHVIGVSAPLAETPEFEPAGLFVISADAMGVAETVSRELKAAGADAEIVDRSTLADQDRLRSWINARRAAGQTISGVIHLAGLSLEGMPAASSEWRMRAQIDVKSFWALLNGFGDDLLRSVVRGRAWVFAASNLDGAFGRNEMTAEFSPTAGGGVGLLKTAAAEWRGVNAKALDFAQSISAAKIASILVREIRHPGRDLEIGYGESEQRLAYRTQMLPLKNSQNRLEVKPDWVVLLTGGARGITARIAEEIAAPGSTFVLAGRTQLPDTEDAEIAGVKDAGALRSALLSKVKASGESVTPTTIESRVRKILAAREVRANLRKLASAGVNAQYHVVDVRDERSFRDLIDQIYEKYGRIDAVIHGAGVIEDRLIVDKTEDSFSRVFDTKCTGAYVLSETLRPESLKFVSFFTSVAGRYGNRGQSDYAAANETLNRFAWSLRRRWPHVRIVGVNWGPWDAPGMVTDEIKSAFAKRGLEPIPIDAGCRFFADELREGRLDDVEIIAGVGPWGQEVRPPSVEESTAKKSDGATANGDGRFGRALIEAVRSESLDGFLCFEHTLDLDVHQYLDDHRLDGTPVVPAAAAAEWMAQIAQGAWPDWRVSQISDLRVLKGLRLEGSNAKKVLFRARASSHADASEMKVSLTLGAPDSQVLYYKCAATLVRDMAEPMEASVPPLTRGEAIDPGDAYKQYLFHGPRFQLIRAISRLDREGIDAEVNPSRPSQWLRWGNGGGADRHAVEDGSWLFDPGLVDAALQTVLVWSRTQMNSTPLPSSFGALTRFDKIELNERMSLRCRIRPGATETKIGFDAQFVDQHGKIRMLMENIEVTGSKALNRLGGTA